MVNYRLRKLLCIFLASDVQNIGTGWYYLNSLWENLSLIALSRLRIIISRHWEANYSLSFLCKGVVKKQSFKSVTIRGYLLGKREGKGIPDCREPIGWITLLTALRSVTILHFPDFFLTTNTGEVQELPESSICWTSSCFCIRCSKPAVSLLLRDIA